MNKFLQAVFIINILSLMTVVAQIPQEIPAESVAVSVDSLSVSVDSVEMAALRQCFVADSLFRAADSLRLNYEFVLSTGLCRQALEVETDSLRIKEIKELERLSRNGANMLDFVYVPSVVTNHTFSMEDFFLYYPLPDSSWRALPPGLDSLKNNAVEKAVFAPSGSTEVYFSAADEIYPLLSDDGQSMYFASKDLYGMGGYDLYVSHRDGETGEWGMPENLGFPYSSPYDDFLYCDTPDGKYTFFASNRDCSADSVKVYVLEYENLPLRRAVGGIDSLRQIMRLHPTEDRKKTLPSPTVKMPENTAVREYMNKMSEVRALRDSIDVYALSLEEDRNRFATSDDVEERTELTDEIMRKEARMPQFRKLLEESVRELQAIEMEFIFSGIVIDMEKVNKDADREMVSGKLGYTFTRKNMGDSLRLVLPLAGEKVPAADVFPAGVKYKLFK